MLPSRAGHARAAFLQLPSHLRLRAYQQCSSRAFSASVSRSAEAEATEAAAQALDLAHIIALPPLAVLNGLHAIGIPWYAVIPTTAILIRGVFGHYFASVPARRRQQVNTSLHPLVAARIDQVIHGDKRRTNQVPNLLGRLRLQIGQTHKYGREFGGGLIAFSSVLNFGSMIATAEAVRMKCGARDGLLSTIMAPFNWLQAQMSQTGTTAASESRAQKLAERLERVRELRLQQAQEQSLGAQAANDAASAQPFVTEDLFTAAQSLPPPPPVSQVPGPFFDPALQTEGFSWCTDLTAADPTHILPLLTGGAMLATVVLNPLKTPRWVPRAQGMPAPIKFIMTRYSISQRVFAAITVAVGYSLQYVPAAVSLYLFSTFVIGAITKRWLDLTMPLRNPIKACARKTRRRSKKEWGARG